MFYLSSFTDFFRMGDVLKGFSEILPVFNTIRGSDDFDFSIKITNHDYYVILTPCCSIENQEAIIVPLRQIDSKFLVSTYIINNFLIINKPMSHKEAIGDTIFGKLSPDSKAYFDSSHPSYEYHDIFIYDQHVMFKSYEIIRKRKEEVIKAETNMYMISFKDAIKIKCSLFDRNKDNVRKILELTPFARDDLRNKLVKFYSRIPDEDAPFLL